jgi:hypothetical protein
MSTAPRPAQRDVPGGDATPHAGRDARARRRPVRARAGAGPAGSAPDVRPAPILAALAALAAAAAFVAASAGAAHAQAAPVGLRPYAQVVPAGAVSDTGVITVHRVGDRWLFEVPDALTTTPGGRDFLLVTRLAGVPAGFDGLAAAGTAVADRVVRWERRGARLLLRSVGFGAVAGDAAAPPGADSLVARAVEANSVAPVLAAFPVQAFRPGAAGDGAAVVDVTEFLAGDTPALSGLTEAQRQQYQVRRLDPARGAVHSVRAFATNVQVRQTQTFEAGAPPADRPAGALTLEVRHSLVLLPARPMRPRPADARVGFFTVERVNYGADAPKAVTERFIRRWRLEPADSAAYRRGEVVAPVRPVVFYLDPAIPARWRPYVREGVESWRPALAAAGFRDAIVAKDPPSAAADPDWDLEDGEHSVVRWAPSLARDAGGPSVWDPRSGEVLAGDVTFYHNYLRAYRDRLVVETGAANPAARTPLLPDSVMGPLVRQIIAHEVGHVLGLTHNLAASSAVPVDSLRSPAFARRVGVSMSLMDYARQNYVAQPGDGLAPADFVRRLGPWDVFAVVWGYRALPDAPTPAAERATLHRWLAEERARRGAAAYRFGPDSLVGTDPRVQVEDLGDDSVRASAYGVANLRRVVARLAAWATRPGEGPEDLAELHAEAVRMWGLYMGHVSALVGGVAVDARTGDEREPAYRPVPPARQRAALAFLARHALRTPGWLAPEDVRARLGPQADAAVAERQAQVMADLLDAARMARMAALHARAEAHAEARAGVGAGAGGAPAGSPDAYPVAAYLADLRRALWGGAPDANRRALQRAYVDRLAALLAPAADGAAGALARTDVPALARGELAAVRDAARRAAAAAPPGARRAHWADLAARVDAALARARAGTA